MLHNSGTTVIIYPVCLQDYSCKVENGVDTDQTTSKKAAAQDLQYFEKKK